MAHHSITLLDLFSFDCLTKTSSSSSPPLRTKITMTTYSSIPPSETPMELTHNESSVSNSSLLSSPYKYVILAAVGIVSFAAGRHSYGEGEKVVVELPTTVEKLCEVYVPMRVIQTSRGEPSRQWKEVGCVHRERRLAVDKSDDRDEEVNESGTSDVTAASPAATINVNFNDVPFLDREPILGFGGAFTEAAALNYGSLSDEGKKAVMELLFGKDGLGYSLGRTHINSCDFSIASYSHDDTEDDFTLSQFDTLVSHDLNNGMVDMMLSASSTLKQAYPNEEGMKLIASPWSPPAWMKAPREGEENVTHASNMTGSAEPVCLRDGVGVDSEYARSWALFFSKWLDAYSNHGLNFYGITVQNEPEFAAPWDACAYDNTNEGQFIANHLGPQLKSTHPDVKLFIFDHNKDHIVNWTTHLLAHDHPAREFIDGTAFHWYAGGLDRLLDGAQGSPNLHRTVSSLNEMDVPKTHVLFNSEACHCPSTGYAGGNVDIAWDRATRNAHALLADLASGSNGFIEWNLILDSIGGPNHLGNMCDSPLLAVPHRASNANNSIPTQMDFEKAHHPFGKVHGDGKTREELNAEGVSAKYLDVGVAVQQMYYYVGHVTKFVRPGSRVVHALVDGSEGGPVERTFRPKGQTVAGGGINDLAREGMEVTLWPCEGSTRQQWKYNEDKQIQVFGHDWLGVPTTSCLGKRADESMGGLMMTTCNMTVGGMGYYEVDPVADSTGKVNIVLKNSKVASDKSCLVVQPLRNNGGAYGPRGGAQVNIGDCTHPWAEWVFDTITGEIASTAMPEGEVCLTTGWPFLQVGAFDTSAAGPSAKTVIVLNEAGEAANFVIKNEGEVIMSSSIPPQSIQTISFD